MTVTLGTLIQEAMEVVGEVSGSGSQAYSEDRMRKDAIRAFDYLHKKTVWPQYLQWNQLTLDGSTGKVTTNTFFYAKDPEDILAVFRAGESTPLPVTNHLQNPFLLTGTRPLKWRILPVANASYFGKRIQIWPLAATGDIVVGHREYPMPYLDEDGNMEAWTDDDLMMLDKNMLVHAVAWMTLSGDDINSGAAQDQMMLMEQRYNDVTKNLASKRIHIEGNPGVPMD